VVAAASEVVGGPVGRYAALGPGHGRPWPVVAALLAGASSFVVALGVAQKAHCLKVGWNSPDQFWHACYSDLPVTWQSSGLSRGIAPYLDSAGDRVLDQPVVSGLAMWLVGLAVPDGAARAQQQWYVALWAVIIALLVAVLVWVTAASVRRTPWNAAHVAFSPLLVTVALVSTDLLGVVLTSLALWAWGRRSVPLAGVLLGLAVATRSYALVVLLAIGLLALRSGRLRSFGTLAATSVGTLLVVTLPWLLGGDRVLTSYRGWWSAGASYGSPWMVPALFGHGLPRGAVTTLAALGWVLAVAVGAVLALSLNRRPTVAEVSLVMLAIVLVTGTTLPPQASLWLLPLVALVGLRWRDHLIWAGAEAAHFVAVWLYIAGLTTPDRGLPGRDYAVFLLARVAAIIYLAVRVWLGAARRGPVEQSGDWDDADETDELAGPMAGAPDRVLVRLD
jgi:uncharacterized membrane protein